MTTPIGNFMLTPSDPGRTTTIFNPATEQQSGSMFSFSR